MALAIGALLSAALGFLLGHGLALRSLLRAGLASRGAFGLAFVADAISTAIMKIAHSGLTLLLSGTAHLGPHTVQFWIGLIGALVLAAFAAYPANHWLIGRRGAPH